MNSDWQYKIYEKIKNKKINKIVLPGTHDSGAYKIMTSKTFISDKLKRGQIKFNYFRLASKFIPTAYFIVKNWTVTQNKNIYDQLKLGIRSFDLRILWSNYQKKWLIGHSIAVTTYKEVIDDFSNFLKSYKNEFIIIQIKRDYVNRHTVNGKVKDFWEYTRSQKDFFELIWFDKKIPTYEELIKSGKRIILIISSDLRTNIKKYNTDKLFVMNKEYVSYWPNTNNLQKSINSQKKWLTNRVNKSKKFDNKFVDVLATFTPKTGNILKDAECLTLLSIGIVSIVIIIILISLFIYGRPENENLKKLYDGVSKNKRASIVFFIIVILVIITFFVRKCPNRILSIINSSIPLQDMFINMFNEDKKILNKVSIITFDVPKKETVDYVINLNKSNQIYPKNYQM